MRVLVACEYSGVVRDAFTAKGHDAMSCDLLPTESPGDHYQGDVRDVLGDSWDLLIAHPPCTYLSRAGACRMYPTAGVVDEARLTKAMVARAFFLELLNAPIPRVCVENPVPLKVADLPPHQAVVQPYDYGSPFSKKTLLWLKNLPPLLPVEAPKPYVPFLPSNTGGAKRGQRHTNGIARDAKTASRFWPGIAKAMAEQWT